MRPLVLFAGLGAISTMVIAAPAAAKASIAEANITGPGLDGGIRLEAADTDGLWESGIDVVGGLDDTRADAVEELGLAPADLGPKYLVTYRFEGDDLISQDLYPYAKGGPVRYTPPGQEVTAGINMQITSGWYQSSPSFFQYLVDHGLSETKPVVQDAAPRAQTGPGAGIVAVLVALATTLSLAALAVRRRVLPGASSTARHLRLTAGRRGAVGQGASTPRPPPS